MIEAVNSTIASVATSRGVTGQVDAQPPLPEGAPDVPQAPFVSPYISVDLDLDIAVLQIRDSETGDVQQQFPTQSRLAQIRRARDVQESVDLQQNRQTQPVNEAVVTAPQGPDVVTIQDVTSSQASNSSLPSPQIAVAALSTGAQSGQVSESAGVSVFA